MASSQELMQKIEGYGEMPDFKSGLAELYSKPVLKPLTREAANLEGNYLSSIFEPFTKMGTGAADLSPAAKLAGIGGSLGRLSGRIGANQSVQNFYGAQIQDLANLEKEKWQQKKNDLMSMYQMQFQKEEADRAEAARQRAEAMQRASMAQAQMAPQFAPQPQVPGIPKEISNIMDNWKYMLSTLGNMTPQQKWDWANKNFMKSSAFQNQMNAIRAAGGDPNLIFKQIIGI